MKLKPATTDQAAQLDAAISYLRKARYFLVGADCPNTLDSLRATIKSAEGARRHMQRRLKHATEE